jgi:hypothetical protein
MMIPFFSNIQLAHSLSASQFIYESLKLSISSPEMDCHEVAVHLKKVGILANTAPNLTSYNKGVENGCVITCHQITKPTLHAKIWEPLKDKYSLTCGHVHAQGLFSGCYYDFMRPTQCPHRTT